MKYYPANICPTCESPAPHLHPAVQFEGEVQPCRDKFHQQVTTENATEKIAEINRSAAKETKP